MTLRKKQIKIVGLAQGESESDRGGVQIYAPCHRTVNASEINSQFVIKENKQVIIPGEGEDLAPLIGKCGVELIREVIAVATALIAKKLITYRKKDELEYV